MIDAHLNYTLLLFVESVLNNSLHIALSVELISLLLEGV